MLKTLLAVLAAASLLPLPHAAAAEPAKAPRLRAMTLRMTHPKFWERHPSRGDVEAAFPAFAAKNRIDGHAVLNCRVAAEGYLEACVVENAQPRGAGFEAAALRLAPFFKLSPSVADGRSLEGGLVRVPIMFGAPRS